MIVHTWIKLINWDSNIQWENEFKICVGHLAVLSSWQLDLLASGFSAVWLRVVDFGSSSGFVVINPVKGWEIIQINTG